ICKTLEPEHARALIDNQATANPLFLTVALEELRLFGGFKTLRRKIAGLPQLAKPARGKAPSRTIDEALDEIFGQVLDRLSDEATRRDAPDLVPTLFRLLASAKEGLSERELEDLLGMLLPGVEGKRREGEVQVVLRQVRGYMMRKGPVLDFFHRS